MGALGCARRPSRGAGGFGLTALRIFVVDWCWWLVWYSLYYLSCRVVSFASRSAKSAEGRVVCVSTLSTVPCSSWTLDKDMELEYREMTVTA